MRRQCPLCFKTKAFPDGWLLRYSATLGRRTWVCGKHRKPEMKK